MQILEKGFKEPRELPLKVVVRGSRFVIEADKFQLIFTPKDMRKLFRIWVDWILPK